MCALVYISPLVGIALVVKSFLLCLWNYCYVYNLSHRLYIYILLFCGDPFFHLRAHPTQMMGWVVVTTVAVPGPSEMLELGLVRLCAGVGCTPCFLGLGIGF